MIKTALDSWDKVVVICQRAGDQCLINGARQKILDSKLSQRPECCVLSFG